MISFGEKEDGKVYTAREGVYALIPDRQGNIAIVGRAGREFYELPGGGLEGEETHEEGLTRELREELGWSAHIGPYMGSSSQYVISKKGKYWRLVGHFYLAENYLKIGGKIEEDHTEVWLPVREATEKVVHLYQRWAIRSFLLHE